VGKPQLLCEIIQRETTSESLGTLKDKQFTAEKQGKFGEPEAYLFSRRLGCSASDPAVPLSANHGTDELVEQEDRNSQRICCRCSIQLNSFGDLLLVIIGKWAPGPGGR
jgi:hypothetical protein